MRDPAGTVDGVGIEPVDAGTVLDFGGWFLAQDDNGCWLMGGVVDGVLRCWADHGSDLGEAVRSF